MKPCTVKPSSLDTRAFFWAALCFLAFLGWIPRATAASLPSEPLFFAPEEVAIAEPLLPHARPGRGTGHYLGALLYYGEGRWTLWLDGMKITPQTAPASPKILAVTPESVTLQVDGRTVTLRPHQRYDQSSQSIEEGP